MPTPLNNWTLPLPIAPFRISPREFAIDPANAAMLARKGDLATCFETIPANKAMLAANGARAICFEVVAPIRAVAAGRLFAGCFEVPAEKPSIDAPKLTK